LADIPSLSSYELIKDGKLKTVKVAGRRLVPMAALRELIESIFTWS